MDTTKIIKLFVVAEIILGVVYLFLTFSLESKLPPLLQDYLALIYESEITTVDLVVLWGGIPVLLVYGVAVVGLLYTRIWAKNVYAFSALAGYALRPFIGPTVEHAISATVYDLATLLTGVILALLFFTNSAFNKAFNSPSAGTAKSAAP